MNRPEASYIVSSPERAPTRSPLQGPCPAAGGSTCAAGNAL